MAQAKGILPRRDDREVLYKSPRTCGYFVGVKLDPAMDRPRLEAWLTGVSGLVDELVARLPAEGGQEKGEKVAAVAVGLAPTFFTISGISPASGTAVKPPGSFRPGTALPNAVPPLSGVPLVDAAVMFYVASVFEARVNAFVSGLAKLRPDVQAITLERGYQRLDETEHFGYRDGVRNAEPKDQRPKIVFVHRDGHELDEPAWADGGSYMAYLKIRQHPDQFAQLPDDATRDGVIGRTKDGTRLDLVGRGVKPHAEPAEVPDGLPPSSHVRKTGPRGRHDDTRVFRRGLPYMETTSDGQLAVGLHFCSFQASLDQFDVLFNDWSLNRQFPPLPPGSGDAGTDALLDPARGFTAIEKAGFFFVPPYHPDGLAAAVLAVPPAGRPPRTGRLVVHKRVTDPNDSNRRFERGGFVFQVLDAQGQPIGGQFTTDSTGRGICPVELPLGQPYMLQELSSPVPNVTLTNTPFAMDKPNQQLQVGNQVTQPNTPYGM
jgi:deferrochelatase/peroxidase EfeB